MSLTLLPHTVLPHPDPTAPTLPPPDPSTRRPAPVPTALPRDDRGQATTEYALVLLGAALVALLLIAWATAGGGAGKVGRLFDAVLDAIIGRI